LGPIPNPQSPIPNLTSQLHKVYQYIFNHISIHIIDLDKNI
jgi:hypothetical protein